jgi:membrane protease YdiL (CAAX protease family)
MSTASPVSEPVSGLRQSTSLPLIGAGALLLVQIGLFATGFLLLGDLASAVLVVVLLTASPRLLSAEAVSATRALAVVAALPVIALGLPLRDGSLAAGTFVLAALTGGLWLAASPVIGINRARAFSPRRPLTQLPVALTGVGLGFLAYLAGAPRGWAPGASTFQMVLDGAALVCIAVAEELIFRWLLQASFQRLARRSGLIATIAVTSAVYAGSGPPSLVVVMAIAAVVFAFGVDRSGSALGALGGRIGLVLAAGFGGPLLIGAVGLVVVHFPRWRGWQGTAALVIWLLLATVVTVRGAKGRASRGGAVR